MRAAFLGTPSAAVPCLAAVADVVDVTVVVTRPDRARGRGRKPGETAVKVAAREWGLRTAQPEGCCFRPGSLRSRPQVFSMCISRCSRGGGEQHRWNERSSKATSEQG